MNSHNPNNLIEHHACLVLVLCVTTTLSICEFGRVHGQFSQAPETHQQFRKMILKIRYIIVWGAEGKLLNVRIDHILPKQSWGNIKAALSNPCSFLLKYLILVKPLVAISKRF